MTLGEIIAQLQALADDVGEDAQVWLETPYDDNGPQHHPIEEVFKADVIRIDPAAKFENVTTATANVVFLVNSYML